VLAVDRTGRQWSDDALFALLATWIPGLSYVVKVMLMALTGLSAARFIVLGVLSQLSAALLYLLLGEFALEVGIGWFALTILAALIVLSMVRRIALQHRASADGQRSSTDD